MPDRNIFLHSLKMVKRNIRGYVFLSISVTLSFFILLLYLFGYDTYLYNKYKYAFQAPKDIAIICELSDGASNMSGYRKQLEKFDDVTFYEYCEQSVWLEQYGDCSLVIQRIPANVECFYQYDESGSLIKRVNVLQGDYHLKSDEMIIEKKFYDILKNSTNTEELSVSIAQVNKEGKREIKEYNIVGFCEDIEESDIEVNELGDLMGHMYAFALYDDNIGDYINRRMLVCSENIMEKVQLAENFDLGVACPYVFQQDAVVEMQKASRNKLIMVITILFFLGLNLFGNFRNTLEKRSYEIGVKRAIGAGKREILGQFLFEGVIVMIGNIILSALFVLNVMVVVKYVNILQGNELVLYMNQFSLLTYLVCCIFLSFIFSMIFAYQAVNVEIIKNIKEE